MSDEVIPPVNSPKNLIKAELHTLSTFEGEFSR
jgi:hypothetical protein